MVKKSGHTLRLAVVLLTVLSVAASLLPLPATAAGAPTIEVVPRVTSLWGLDILPEANFSPGPAYATIIVHASADSTVTLNLKNVFEQVFPTAPSKLSLLPESLQEAYNDKMDSLTAVPFVWDAGLGAWTHELGTEEAITEPSSTVRAIAETVLFQEASLGDITLPITIDGVVNSSNEVTVVDMQRPLLPGWSVVSTPTHLANPKFGDVVKTTDLTYTSALTWDSRRGRWVTFSPYYSLEPLNAVYIQTPAGSFNTMGLTFSRTANPPAEATLWQGWNLVGASVVKGKDDAGDAAFFELPVNEMLSSAGSNYSTVVSPGESWSYTQELTDFDGNVINTYDWSFTQEGWTYAPSGTPPQAVIGGGYWVYLTSRYEHYVGQSATPIQLTSWNPFD